MLSIIIPVLNEATIIQKLLKHLKESIVLDSPVEIIVVDGGSSDHTMQLVADFASENKTLDISMHRSDKGRARQMNKGAAEAKGNVLYFLHADSFPPKGFDSSIQTELTKGNLAGCFRMKFDRKHIILRISQWFTRFNYKACRGGDQSLFVSRAIFDRLNGFDEDYMVYEDCEFIGRIYDQYHFTVIKKYVITSARRYTTNGTFKLQYHFAVIHLKKWTGANAGTLTRYYNKHILS